MDLNWGGGGGWDLNLGLCLQCHVDALTTALSYQKDPFPNATIIPKSIYPSILQAVGYLWETQRYTASERGGSIYELYLKVMARSLPFMNLLISPLPHI